MSLLQLVRKTNGVQCAKKMISTITRMGLPSAVRLYVVGKDIVRRNF